MYINHFFAYNSWISDHLPLIIFFLSEVSFQMWFAEGLFGGHSVFCLFLFCLCFWKSSAGYTMQCWQLFSLSTLKLFHCLIRNQASWLFDYPSLDILSFLSGYIQTFSLPVVIFSFMVIYLTGSFYFKSLFCFVCCVSSVWGSLSLIFIISSDVFLHNYFYYLFLQLRVLSFLMLSSIFL